MAVGRKGESKSRGNAREGARDHVFLAFVVQ
jgi:hypothetical protein